MSMYMYRYRLHFYTNAIIDICIENKKEKLQENIGILLLNNKIIIYLLISHTV